MSSPPPPLTRVAAPYSSPPRRSPRGQGVLVGLGLVAAGPAIVATWLRVLPPASDRLAKLASFIPYGLLCWLPALLLIGVAVLRGWRHRLPGRVAVSALALLCAAGLAVTVAWQAPAFVADRRPAGTESLTVTSLNVAGTADPAAAARAVADADVAIFVEAHRDWIDRLPRSVRATFRYLAPTVRASHGGETDTVILSRYPLTSVEALPREGLPHWSAVVRTPQLGAVRVVAVHPCNPYCSPGLWMQDAAELRAWLATHRDAAPMIVAGDFNAVDDHLTMQNLYADGFRSAADLTGAGFVRTWPSDRWFPPLIGIDHVLLTPGLTATAFDTFRVRGTDHLGIRTSIAGTKD